MEGRCALTPQLQEAGGRSNLSRGVGKNSAPVWFCRLWTQHELTESPGNTLVPLAEGASGLCVVFLCVLGTWTDETFGHGTETFYHPSGLVLEHWDGVEGHTHNLSVDIRGKKTLQTRCTSEWPAFGLLSLFRDFLNGWI